MSGTTKIQWTDAVWNPVSGCTRVSAGCQFCYAFELHDKRYKANRDAARNVAMGTDSLDAMKRSDAVLIARARADGFLPLPKQYDVPFSRVQLLPERLEAPLHWRKPRRVFVNSMSDLFHEDVPDEFIDRVFAVMALTPQHTYQVLTKRPERMRAYLAGQWTGFRQRELMAEISGQAVVEASYPLRNVWLGTSVENQAMLDERTVHLLATPAAVRFLSCEPMLEEVDVTPWLHDSNCVIESEGVCICSEPREERIDWVIVGGESGAKARPCNIEWIRDIVGQCRAAGVPVFVKQLGSACYSGPDRLCGANRGSLAGDKPIPDGFYRRLKSRHGSDPSEWPEDLKIRQFPSGVL